MNAKKLVGLGIGMAVACGLFAGGVAQAAFEGPGPCTPGRGWNVRGGVPDVLWGNSQSNGGTFVLTGTVSGTSTLFMDVNLGSNFLCADAFGTPFNSPTNVKCWNRDTVADGSSVQDTTGGCNGSDWYTAEFWNF
jgi:hypothetical protein